jgi:hypothetical protein
MTSTSPPEPEPPALRNKLDALMRAASSQEYVELGVSYEVEAARQAVWDEVQRMLRERELSVLARYGLHAERLSSELFAV